MNVNWDKFDDYHSHNVIIPNFIIQSAGCSYGDWHVGVIGNQWEGQVERDGTRTDSLLSVEWNK